MQRSGERQPAELVQNQEQLAALELQRSELQNQLGQLQRRRNQLDEQRQGAPSNQARAIESQMADLDARAARIDRQLLSLNDQVAAALARRTQLAVGQGTAQPTAQGDQPTVIRIPQISIPPIDLGRTQRRNDMRQIGGIMAAEAVALVLIGIIAWRAGMKRMRDQFDRMFAAQTQQMNQLQQAVDTVAVEVERISEGQRYVAKVLAEGSPASALPVGRREQGR